MKIGFLSLDHLKDWNGITRLIDRIASDMQSRGHEVTVIALDAVASKKIPVSALAYPHTLVTFDIEKLDEAREKITASGIEICVTSFASQSLSIMPKIFKGSGIPYIIGESFDPRILVYEWRSPYEHFKALYSADAVQVLLPQYIEYYPEPIRKKITVIGNPVGDIADINLEARRNKESRAIICVGRFSDDEKRFSLLLRAFALLKENNDFPEWRLKLVGDGPFWDYYNMLAQKLGIKKYVDFTGAVSNVNEHYESADIFCLPSRGEGFPMVLTEAAAHALPLAGYRTCIAMDALIEPDMGVVAEHNEQGQDTPEALAEKLRTLMQMTPEEREKIGITARNKMQAAYGDKIIFDKWEALIMKTVNDIKEYWDGLTHDSPVWTEGVLSGEDAENAEIVRLKCEVAKLTQAHAELWGRYNALKEQYQFLAVKKGKRR